MQGCNVGCTADTLQYRVYLRREVTAENDVAQGTEITAVQTRSRQ